jgi:hypothetical protein
VIPFHTFGTFFLVCLVQLTNVSFSLPSLNQINLLHASNVVRETRNRAGTVWNEKKSYVVTNSSMQINCVEEKFLLSLIPSRKRNCDFPSTQQLLGERPGEFKNVKTLKPTVPCSIASNSPSGGQHRDIDRPAVARALPLRGGSMEAERDYELIDEVCDL